MLIRLDSPIVTNNLHTQTSTVCWHSIAATMSSLWILQYVNASLLNLLYFACHRYFLFPPSSSYPPRTKKLSQFFNLGNAVLILVTQDKSEINHLPQFYVTSKVNEIFYDNSEYCIIFLVYLGELVTNLPKISCFIYKKQTKHSSLSQLINFNIFNFQKL